MIEATESPAPARRRRQRGLYAIYAAALLAGVLVAFIFLKPHEYAGAVIQSPSRAPSLDDMFLHTGEPAELWRFDGDVVLMYFGYTHCPDVCPTTLAAIARAKEQLGNDGDRIHALMVTVDPDRDTPTALGDYMTHFDPAFLGVYGDEQATRQAAVLYGIHIERHEGTAASGYVVDHTAHLIAIDTDGFIRVIYPTDVAPDALASDLKDLLG